VECLKPKRFQLLTLYQHWVRAKPSSQTVDQYYAGLNSSIQRASVQNILDTVLRSLMEDERRTFMYVETAFLARWWREQSDTTKAQLRSLVDQGRLEIVNGGYCMHDEAATYYTDMIDQTTLGHRFLEKELGVVPRIGWQIDPFGHSSVHVSLSALEWLSTCLVAHGVHTLQFAGCVWSE
jgi:alpha-mannosidase